MSPAENSREDLFYRINVVPLELIPLRERKDDIPVLFHHFVLIAAARYDRESIPLDASQATRLMQHSWPGNVRELANVGERAAIVSRGDKLQVDIRPAASPAVRSVAVGALGGRGAMPATALAMERMCSGVVPQQPPTKLSSPASA